MRISKLNFASYNLVFFNDRTLKIGKKTPFSKKCQQFGFLIYICECYFLQKQRENLLNSVKFLLTIQF